MFYPSVPAQELDSSSLDYVLFAAFMGGLLGPILVRSVRAKAKNEMGSTAL
jgi:hypothetical protein